MPATRSRARRSRCRLPPPRSRARGGRVAALLRARGLRRRAARARFARAVRRSRDAGAARRPRRFRVRDAGAGQRRDHAGGNRGAAGALAAGGCARRGDRRVRAVGARRRLRRRGDDHARASATARIGCSTAPRRGSPTAASPISIACSPAPASASGTSGISAFVVPADTPGLSIAERIETIAPHPLARLAFAGCRLPADALLGAEGEGFKLAMRTLDIFRASVAAAALGFARRALDEAAARARTRPMFGGMLGDLQLTQAEARRDGHRHRCRGAAHLSRGLAARRARRARRRAKRRWPR